MFYLKKYILILALEMCSPVNQQCANCIGTLSIPIVPRTGKDGRCHRREWLIQGGDKKKTQRKRNKKEKMGKKQKVNDRKQARGKGKGRSSEGNGKGPEKRGK